MAAQPIAQAGPALSAWGLAASLMLLGGLIQSVEWVLGTLPWAQGSPSVLPSMLLPDCLSERAVAWAAREGWERRNTLPWRLLFIEPSTPSPSSFLPPSRIDTLPSWAKAILGRSSFLLLASKNKVPLGLCPGSSGNEFQSVLKDQLWVNGIWLEPGGGGGGVGGGWWSNNHNTGLALVQETYGINWVGRQCYLLTKPSVWNVAQVRNLRGLCGWSWAVEYHSRA